MTLRIIGGRWRGRKLATLSTLETRPTANRTREALFNILAFKLHDACVLDLFAGSGALGLESLSRGARRAVFVESDRKACEIIVRNIALCDAGDQAELYRRGVEMFCGPAGAFDLVLLDPPYGRGLVNATLVHLAQERLPRPGALVVAEHESGLAPVYDTATFALTQSRIYGKAALSIFKYQPDESAQND